MAHRFQKDMGTRIFNAVKLCGGPRQNSRFDKQISLILCCLGGTFLMCPHNKYIESRLEELDDDRLSIFYALQTVSAGLFAHYHFIEPQIPTTTDLRQTGSLEIFLIKFFDAVGEKYDPYTMYHRWAVTGGIEQFNQIKNIWLEQE